MLTAQPLFMLTWKIMQHFSFIAKEAPLKLPYVSAFFCPCHSYLFMGAYQPARYVPDSWLSRCRVKGKIVSSLCSHRALCPAKKPIPCVIGPGDSRIKISSPKLFSISYFFCRKSITCLLKIKLHRCLLFKSRKYFSQKNTGQNGGKPKLDLNVLAAWAQGVTGKNITTAIMDDGIKKTVEHWWFTVKYRNRSVHSQVSITCTRTSSTTT